MIEIVSHASGSSGNFYTISDGTTTVAIECGLPLKKIRQAMGFRVSGLAGVLLSHEHLDHSKAAGEVMKAGIYVYASHGTFTAIGLSGHRVKRIEAKKQFKLGTWTVMPFDVEHDAAEPLGFLLLNQAGEKLLFATDTYYIRYRFPGLTHIMVECNYSIQILNENIAAGRVPASLKPRLLKSHFSLEHVKDFLLANDLSKVQEIWLLHLSSTNSNEEMFKREIQALTGKVVYVAHER
ncbi:MBL fold metallo-hydrolase [Effusibacillus consociatus]|uniref:MBL fold metallo-hydrolase n=1 Tax=Effusibacillus consociatus TaxID=1117041 RepID=A0ABV9Q7U3_9BACL